jgi:hypothetical protein
MIYDRVIIKTDKDGNEYFDENQMASETLCRIMNEWRMRHIKGTDFNSEYYEINSSPFYNARF